MVSCTSQRISVYLIYYKTEETPCFFIRGTKFTIFTKPIIRAPCLLPQIFHNNCLQFLLGITVVPSKIDDNRKGSGGGGGQAVSWFAKSPHGVFPGLLGQCFLVTYPRRTAGRNTNRSDHVTRKNILRGPSSKAKSQSSFRNENSTFSFLIVIINMYRVCHVLSFYKSEKSGHLQLAPSFYGWEGGIYEGVPHCFSTELLGST